MAKRKRRLWRFPNEFRSAAVQRVKNGETIAAVACDVDVHRRLLRTWIYKANRAACGKVPVVENGSQTAFRQENQQAEPVLAEKTPEVPVAENSYQTVLRRENQQLKQALAEKTLEVDFFKGALQKVEARRQQTNKAGETASTPRLGK